MRSRRSGACRARDDDRVGAADRAAGLLDELVLERVPERHLAAVDELAAEVAARHSSRPSRAGRARLDRVCDGNGIARARRGGRPARVGDGAAGGVGDRPVHRPDEDDQHLLAGEPLVHDRPVRGLDEPLGRVALRGAVGGGFEAVV